MDASVIEDVVKKLVGAINPVGETCADEKRLQNLKAMTALIDGLLLEVADVAHKNSNRCEASMRACGRHAKNFLEYVSSEYKMKEQPND